ncbi:lysylphosphatidylglycerol synthase transmembrane domain-containing protein [Pseudomonas sp. DWP3-1-2]|uniref:lysylphosphatidylglycerol synthase transmembrane domain-containing protein n=1 Tax=Pseudomonas sp. DWP3-1-2 TaxID=2804645 RepID=UPI003CF68D25
MSESLYLSGWRYRAVVLSVVGSALAYLGFSLWGGWHAVSNAVGEVGVIGIALALLLSSVNYGLRFLRWQTYLRVLGHPVPWKPSLTVYLAGFALTTTPGKAGEALRGVLLKRWGVPYPQSFAAFVSERLSDLFAVVLLTLFGLSLYPQAQPMIVVGISLVVIGLLVLSQRRLLDRLAAAIPSHGGKLIGLLRHLIQVLIAAQRCHRLSLLVGVTALSVVAWSAEALAFHWILNWMGADIELTFAVFVYALAMLAGAISFMPGGLGGAEAVMVGLLVWKGMSSADAIAATVLIRLATLWFAVGIGAVMLFKLKSDHAPDPDTAGHTSK